MTALMWAAIIGYSQAAQTLLDSGADLHVRDKKGRTALVLARSQHNTDAVKLLEQYGAK